MKRNPGIIDRFERLPKWAQQEIERLQRSVEWWQQQASVGPEDSTVFAEPHSDAPRPLGTDPVVRFQNPLDPQSMLDVMRMKPGSAVLEIRSNQGAIEVSPQSGNVIRVRATDWWNA